MLRTLPPDGCGSALRSFEGLLEALEERLETLPVAVRGLEVQGKSVPPRDEAQVGGVEQDARRVGELPQGAGEAVEGGGAQLQASIAGVLRLEALFLVLPRPDRRRAGRLPMVHPQVAAGDRIAHVGPGAVGD